MVVWANQTPHDDYLSFSGIIVFLPVYLKTVSRYPDMNVAIDHIVEEGCTAVPRTAVSGDLGPGYYTSGKVSVMLVFFTFSPSLS